MRYYVAAIIVVGYAPLGKMAIPAQSRTPSDLVEVQLAPGKCDFSRYGYSFHPSEIEVFFRMPDRLAVRGKLDKNGSFLPFEAAKQPQARTYNDLNTVAINDRKLFRGVNPMATSPASESVYEYRCGTLIPGVLAGNGYFLPTVGGKIIRFCDYVPDPAAFRIYNLPGEFVAERAGLQPVKR